MNRNQTLVSLAVLGLSGAAFAQTVNWKQLKPTTTPGTITRQAVANALQSRKTLLFGGQTTAIIDETWEWDGAKFTKLNPKTVPPKRMQSTMAYDIPRSRFVMFSGWDGGQYHADTWEFDGTDWTSVTTANLPPVRDHSQMVYDLRRQRVILFGGWNYLLNRTLFNDTWEYDGKNWTQITTTGAPDTRDGHAMAYDPRRGVTVLFGGGRERPANRPVRGDTWEYDSSKATWTQITTKNNPKPRYNAGMVYDTSRGVIVMFGGRDITQVFNDVWEYDGIDWTERKPVRSPSPREYPRMSYDGFSGRVLLSGGVDANNQGIDETWLYGNFIPSTFTTYGAGCASGSQGCKVCLTRNWTQSLASSSTSAKQIAVLEAGNSQTYNFCGADLYCSAKSGTVDVTVSLYTFDVNNAVPGKVLASGTVKVGTSAQSYTATFAKPVVIPANTTYFLVFDKSDQLNLPVSKTGTSMIHWEYTTSWNLNANGALWEYALRCDTGMKVPMLANEGLPVINTSYNVTLSDAPSNRVAVFVIGISDKQWGAFNLPLDLAPVAPGCKLLASLDLMFGVVTDAQGNAKAPVPLPNNTAFLGVDFFHQYLVVEPVNALGLIFSNAGKATIGDS